MKEPEEQNVPISGGADMARGGQEILARVQSLVGAEDWQAAVRCGETAFVDETPGLEPLLAYELHALLATAAFRAGDYSVAESHARASIHIAQWDLRSEAMTSKQRRVLGVIYYTLGRWEPAVHEMRTAIASADASGNAREAVGNRLNLSIVHLKAREWGAVPTLLAEARALCDRTTEPKHPVRIDLVLARYHRAMGSVVRAVGILDLTLEHCRREGFRREEALSLEYLGDCYRDQKEFAKALDNYRQAETIALATAPRGDMIPELGHRIGECLVHLGDPNGAILACENGLRIAIEAADRYEECATHRVLAIAHRAAGNPTKGFRMADQGIALARSYQIPYELARILAWAGRTRLGSTQHDEQMIGRLHLWEARANFERIGLDNEVRAIDQVLGFEELATRPGSGGEPGVVDVAGLDRGALRFGIVTASASMSAAVATIQSVAPSTIPVVIAGPSGTGKELFARALHQMSLRRKRPFVPVNCAALSPGLVDSELFGHGRGAFTGAIANREGLFATANGGTIFLDEVGELSPAAQGTLLRILESGELRPVGTDEVRTIDVRVVAATNADLADMINRGTFRRDLYYRLAGIKVGLTSLADREEDILPLFRYFFDRACCEAGKVLTLANEAEAVLRAYEWPGNVRELRNEVARLVAVAATGTVIGADSLLPDIRAKSPSALRRERKQAAEGRDERAWIVEALRAHKGNKTDAARSLDGMNRSTLLYKMGRHGIQPEEYLPQEQ